MTVNDKYPPMRTLKFTIAFDGTGYSGWQSQPHGNTVQQTLESAMSRILNEKITVHGAGRTDTGVHALGQAAHCTTTGALDIGALQKGANSLLPSSIHIQDMTEANENFHARYRARKRIYWYLIWNSPERSPFLYRYSWHIKKPLAVAEMNRAARALIGVHDFSSFQGADREQVDPVRDVHFAGCKRIRYPVVLFVIQANAFLKHMVRNIVGTLVNVGTGSMTADDFNAILHARDRSLAGITAPPQGLFLRKVVY
jgi:tRNA pseudouridine38-40 synthase